MHCTTPLKHLPSDAAHERDAPPPIQPQRSSSCTCGWYKLRGGGQGAPHRQYTGESWRDTMNDLKVAPPYCTPGEQGVTDCGFRAGSTAFFFTYVILQTYLLTNLFVAAILDNMQSGLLRAKALLGPSHLGHFQVQPHLGCELGGAPVWLSAVRAHELEHSMVCGDCWGLLGVSCSGRRVGACQSRFQYPCWCNLHA